MKKTYKDLNNFFDKLNAVADDFGFDRPTKTVIRITFGDEKFTANYDLSEEEAIGLIKSITNQIGDRTKVLKAIVND